MQLRFARLSEHATAPTRGSARAAGYDLYSAYDYTIPPMEKAVVKTDIQIALPSGCYGRVAPRSGLAAKHFIDVGAGVIDEDYRGNVGVVLFNFGKEKFEVKKGDRIAQLICERIFYPEIEEVQKNQLEHVPVVPATREADSGESFEPRKREVAVGRDHTTALQPMEQGETPSKKKAKQKQQQQQQKTSWNQNVF
ncbi:deoxyuridine 5'-triphosphate nucleotidohydrolase, mitochondrial isoform X7 [Hylobates moloch]|nr:deoxyuridine 5'-triphosphate nucleotidohydrolase, mitochondrial isoform X7 [Hylobates moloch]